MNDERRTYYIKHIQRVAFDVPVFCEPTLIRLHPYRDGRGSIRWTRLDVTPHPAGVREFTDLTGNTAWQVWFNDITMSLNVTVTSCVERGLPIPPSLLHPNNVVPALVPSEDAGLLQRYATPDPMSQRSRFGDTWSTYLSEFRSRDTSLTQRESFELLEQVAAALAERAISDAGQFNAMELRPHGHPPLDDRLGAASDLVEAGRHLGLAARIVRGLHADAADEIDRDMHVWAEFFLPHQGWTGLDPASAQVTDNGYIPISVGPTVDSTAPITGRFRGTSRLPETSTQIILRQAAESTTRSTVVPSR